MGRIFDAAIVGMMMGGVLATLVWLLEKMRGRPLVSERMTRTDMITRLRTMAVDPAISPASREGARVRLEALDAQERASANERFSDTSTIPGMTYFEFPSFEFVRQWIGRLEMLDKRWFFGAVLLAAWAAFCWFRYELATGRLQECHDHLRYYIQRDICVRAAMEARDSIITWALGAPLSLLIAGFALAWAVKQVRR